jgi:hypothetical protein
MYQKLHWLTGPLQDCLPPLVLDVHLSVAVGKTLPINSHGALTAPLAHPPLSMSTLTFCRGSDGRHL